MEQKQEWEKSEQFNYVFSNGITIYYHNIIDSKESYTLVDKDNNAIAVLWKPHNIVKE